MEKWEDWRSVCIIMDIQDFSSWRLIDHRSADRGGDLENMEIVHTFQ